MTRRVRACKRSARAYVRVAADVDGDGKKDIAVLDATETTDRALEILSGDGVGGLVARAIETATRGTLSQGSARHGEGRDRALDLPVAKDWRSRHVGLTLLSMKLSDKGHFAPPPPLPTAAQRVSEALASWDGVHARTHWLLGDETTIDGADFYAFGEELGHIHLEGEAHIFHTPALVDALVQRGLSDRFHWDRAVGVFAIETSEDVEQALWLFRLSYDRLKGARAADLVTVVREAAV